MAKWACMFPGQGSQMVGMLGLMAEIRPEISKVFERASAVLGYDLWAVVSRDPEGQLNQTAFTQPALLVASWALYQIWLKQTDFKPQWVLGHSLGEYTALVAAESLDFVEAVDLVRCRGEYMQEASSDGAMAAIVGPSVEEVTAWCAEFSKSPEVLSPANLNAPGQVVVSGHVSAVERLVAHALKHKVKMAKRLNVSVAAHSALMQSAAEKLSRRLESVRIQPPKIPILNNVDVASVSHPDDIRDMLVRQMVSPVRWTESIERLHAEKVSIFLESGPQKVLSGLNKRISREIQSFPIEKPEEMEVAVTYLRGVQ